MSAHTLSASHHLLAKPVWEYFILNWAKLETMITNPNQPLAQAKHDIITHAKRKEVPS